MSHTSLSNDKYEGRGFVSSALSLCSHRAEVPVLHWQWRTCYSYKLLLAFSTEVCLALCLMTGGLVWSLSIVRPYVSPHLPTLLPQLQHHKSRIEIPEFGPRSKPHLQGIKTFVCIIRVGLTGSGCSVLLTPNGAE